jgi:hypothetical protein
MSQDGSKKFDLMEMFLADIPLEYKDRARRCLLLTAAVTTALKERGYDPKQVSEIIIIMMCAYYRLDEGSWNEGEK